jgi:hypothetical protein
MHRLRIEFGGKFNDLRRRYRHGAERKAPADGKIFIAQFLVVHCRPHHSLRPQMACEVPQAQVFLNADANAAWGGAVIFAY